MKFGYSVLFVLLLSAACVAAGGHSKGRGKGHNKGHGGGHDKVIGNACNTTTPCLETEVCMTTPYGNKCRRMESLPCVENADCPESGSCYAVDASVGMCGGCATDTDCTGGMLCYTHSKLMHGKCVECLAHTDCDASSYCGKGSMCEAKLVDGEECKFDDQCSSGSCVRQSGRRGRGWHSHKRGTCGVGESGDDAAGVDITDIRSRLG